MRTVYDRITSACVHLYHFAYHLNIINDHNPNFTDDDLNSMKKCIEYMDTALGELKEELNKIQDPQVYNKKIQVDRND